ncbi:MAG: hypothetical protein ACP5GX_11525, partial [Anaerolineae bacterium]
MLPLLRRRSLSIGARFYLLLLLIGVLFFSSYSALSRAFSNSALLKLRDCAVYQQNNGGQNLASNLGVLERLTSVRYLLDRALSVDEVNPVARWGLVRVALMSGDEKLAVSAAQEMTPHVDHNLVAYLDVLEAFVRGGAPRQAVAFYDAVEPALHVEAISDTVASALLGISSTEALSRAVLLRPYDLYANYHLWLDTREAKPAAADLHAQRLKHFPEEAILPFFDPLLFSAVEVFPELRREELWNYDTLYMVLNTLVWQRADTPVLESSLLEVMHNYPQEPIWPFFLAELYQRTGDLQQAESMCRRVLDMEDSPPLI